MSEYKKFYLLDASQAKNLAKSNSLDNFKARTKPILSQRLEALDNSMNDILNDKSLSEEEKISQYNQALAKFQATKESVVHTSKIIERPDPGAPIKTISNEPRKTYNPVLSIPKQYQNKAEKLWSHLKTVNDKLAVNQSGEIELDGKTITNTNLTDLLHKAVNPRLIKQEIQGWKEFSSYIKSVNTPKTLLTSEVSRSDVDVRPKRVYERDSEDVNEHSYALKDWITYNKQNASKSRKKKKSS